MPVALPAGAPGVEDARYGIFGRSGLRVSELFLRTMTFGESWGTARRMAGATVNAAWVRAGRRCSKQRDCDAEEI
jgi:hypothetical protein